MEGAAESPCSWETEVENVSDQESDDSARTLVYHASEQDQESVQDCSEENVADYSVTNAGAPLHSDHPEELEANEPPAKIFSDPEDFMKFISAGFQKYVQPIESGLFDVLRQAGALSTDEEEEVKMEVTRRDKAWAASDILRRLSPKTFEQVCMPFLKENFPHVVRGAEFQWNGQTGFGSKCPRHAIKKRMRLKKFVDILRSSSCCTHAESKELLKGSTTVDDKWNSVFEIVKKNSSNRQLKEEVLKALRGIGIDNPHNFPKQFRSGFRCMCRVTMKETVRFQKEILLAPEAGDVISSSSAGYPTKTGTASEGKTTLADIESTVASSMENTELFSEAGAQELRLFQTRKDKAEFECLLEKINKALVDVASAKTYFRKIEDATYRWIMLNEGTVEEQTLKNTSAVSHTLDDLFILDNLETEAQGIWKTLEGIFLSAQEVLAETEDIQQDRNARSFKVPDFHYRTLLGRRHKLANDLKEMKFSKVQFQNAIDATTKEFTLQKVVTGLLQNDSSCARFEERLRRRKLDGRYTERRGKITAQQGAPAELHLQHHRMHIDWQNETTVQKQETGADLEQPNADQTDMGQLKNSRSCVKHDEKAKQSVKQLNSYLGTESNQRLLEQAKKQVERDTRPVEQGEQDTRQTKSNDTRQMEQATKDTRPVEQGEQDTRQTKPNDARVMEQATKDIRLVEQGEQDTRQTKANDTRQLKQTTKDTRQLKQTTKDTRPVDQVEKDTRQSKSNDACQMEQATKDTRPMEQGEQDTRQTKSKDTRQLKQATKDTRPVEQMEKDTRPVQETPKDTCPEQETTKDTCSVEKAEKDIRVIEQTMKDISPLEPMTNDRHSDERKATDKHPLETHENSADETGKIQSRFTNTEMDKTPLEDGHYPVESTSKQQTSPRLRQWLKRRTQRQRQIDHEERELLRLRQNPGMQSQSKEQRWHADQTTADKQDNSQLHTERKMQRAHDVTETLGQTQPWMQEQKIKRQKRERLRREQEDKTRQLSEKEEKSRRRRISEMVQKRLKQQEEERKQRLLEKSHMGKDIPQEQRSR